MGGLHYEFISAVDFFVKCWGVFHPYFHMITSMKASEEDICYVPAFKANACVSKIFASSSSGGARRHLTLLAKEKSSLRSQLKQIGILSPYFLNSLKIKTPSRIIITKLLTAIIQFLERNAEYKTERGTLCLRFDTVLFLLMKIWEIHLYRVQLDLIPRLRLLTNTAATLLLRR